MKDIAIGIEDGDPEAIAIGNRLDRASNTKYRVIYDPEHKLYYGFESYGLSDEKTSSAAFFKYSRYCRDNRYPLMKSSDFQHRLKNVSREEMKTVKADKGTRFKILR